ncbi:hypothetical protein DXC92_11835 [Clostridiales bacterium TF09-2AC]|nr:hypothetical protein DXC92_11835 [Clostridiales bacterium TF09-2AC]
MCLRGIARACLKIAFRQLCVPLCGRFGPDEGGVAGYVDRIGTKYAAKWGLQTAGMSFQTRSRRADTGNGFSVRVRLFSQQVSRKNGFFNKY